MAVEGGGKGTWKENNIEAEYETKAIRIRTSVNAQEVKEVK